MKIPAILLFIFSLFQISGHAQKKQEEILFSEVISGDSLKIYFTHDFSLTGKECHEIVRYSKVTADGYFYGTFRDYTKSGDLLGRGSYTNGQMSGLFETFYPGEVLKTQGKFHENIPVGNWMFFYETGALNRQLRMEGGDTLIVTLVSEKGDTLVKNGEGRFEGQVGVLKRRMFEEQTMFAKGEVKNFRRSGKWTGYIREFEKDHLYNREVFDNGKLQKGTFPNAKAGFQRDYCCKTSLSPMLEEYYTTPGELVSCKVYKNRALKRSAPKIKNSLESFKTKLNALIKDNRYNNEFWGISRVSIQFTVNTNGKAEEFKVLSKLNKGITNMIETLISERVAWEPATVDNKPQSKVMYFNLFLNADDTGFNYSFNFSPINREL